jgi:hypothetical protein
VILHVDEAAIVQVRFVPVENIPVFVDDSVRRANLDARAVSVYEDLADSVGVTVGGQCPREDFLRESPVADLFPDFKIDKHLVKTGGTDDPSGKAWHNLALGVA